jgi:hypothetical protein
LSGPMLEQRPSERMTSEGTSQSLHLGPSDSTVPGPLPRFELQSSRFPDGLPARVSSPLYSSTATPLEEDKPRGRQQDQNPSREDIHSNRMSRHVREGALSQIEGFGDDDLVSDSASRKERSAFLESPILLDSSPERFRQWRKTMEGIIDGEGVEKHLPRELGISAASLTLAAASPVQESPIETLKHRASLERQPPADTHLTNGTKEPIIINIANLTTSDRQLPLASTQPYRVASRTEEESGHTLSKGIPTDPRDFRGERDDAFPLLLKRGSLAISQPSFPSRSISWGAMAGTSNVTASDDQARSMPRASVELDLQAKELAAGMFEGNEEHVPKDKVAEYLGGLSVFIFVARCTCHRLTIVHLTGNH